MSGAPLRAHELGVRIGADTLDDLVWAVRQVADDLERGQLTIGGWGSPSSGAMYGYRHDPTITYESYFAQLDQYLARLKDAGDELPPEAAAERAAVVARFGIYLSEIGSAEKAQRMTAGEASYLRRRVEALREDIEAGLHVKARAAEAGGDPSIETVRRAESLSVPLVTGEVPRAD